MAGIQRVSELAAAIDLVSDESKENLRSELRKGVHVLATVTDRLKDEVDSASRLESPLSLKDKKLLDAAERLLKDMLVSP